MSQTRKGSVLGSCGLLLKWPFSGCSLLLVVLTIMATDAFKPSNKNSVFYYIYSSLLATILRGEATVEFSLNDTERKWMFILSLFGIFGNVIPKYINDDGAKRHVVQKKGNSALLIHIIAGVATVIGNGVVGMNGGFTSRSILFWVLAGCDLVHQLSIILLLKNHDGVYALRVGNFTALILKFTALLNHNNHGAYISDLFFAASFGFMGTRLGTLLFYIIYSISGSKESVKYEHYYSLGLNLSQLHLVARIPHVEVMALSVIPLTGWLYYHELWRNQFKPHFLFINCIYAGYSLWFLETRASRHIALWLYYATAYAMPRFHRNPAIALQGKKVDVSSKRGAMLLKRQSVSFE